MITFSSDTGDIKRADLEITAKMAEDYFGTETDSEQIPTTVEVRDWVTTHIPDYLNIIRDKQEIIGYAFMLPCSSRLMHKFLAKRINERVMYEGIKKMKKLKNPEAIYLCASFVKEKYRGKGLSTTAFVKAINDITHQGKNKPVLFYWAVTAAGERVVRKVAEMTGLELRLRE